MSLEALVLGCLSGLRPGTSLAALVVLLKTAEPRRPLVFFIAAGLAASWTTGLLVVAAFHGVDVAVGGSTFTAVLDIAFGAAALGYAAGLHQGWVQLPRRRNASAPAADTPSRLARRLQDPSASGSGAPLSRSGDGVGPAPRSWPPRGGLAGLRPLPGRQGDREPGRLSTV